MGIKKISLLDKFRVNVYSGLSDKALNNIYYNSKFISNITMDKDDIILRRKTNKGIEYYTLSSLMSRPCNKNALQEIRHLIIQEFTLSYDKNRFKKSEKRIKRLYKTLLFNVEPCGYNYK